MKSFIKTFINNKRYKINVCGYGKPRDSIKIEERPTDEPANIILIR